MFYIDPRNAKELFNLRMPLFGNAIERIFGVCERKFKILGSVGEFSLSIHRFNVLFFWPVGYMLYSIKGGNPR